MRDDGIFTGRMPGYRVVIVTLDSHAAGPARRAAEVLACDYPGLDVSIHAAAEWGETPGAFEAAEAAVMSGDIIVSNLLFLEEHVARILPALKARRDDCDAMIGAIADASVVKLTRMGSLDTMAPQSGAVKLMKRLRGSTKRSSSSGADMMRMLRRLPKILRFLPGKAQDLRAWFLTMQYWLGGSDDNVEAMVRFLLNRYARSAEWGAAPEAPATIDYPETGLYHPDLAERITTDPADLPQPAGAEFTVGLLMMRSYALSSDTAHYDAVIRAFEARGIRVLPAFAGGLDGRPAIDGYFRDDRGAKVDAMVSLTGFSLVGGSAYNDNASAIEVLQGLDIPYVAAHPLEFQTLGQWAESAQGLGPIETTMLIALPELDGATNPTLFAGRHGAQGCRGCAHMCACPGEAKAMAPCHERVEKLVEKTERLARLRRAENAQKKVGIVLIGFPPNAGAVGTAAYLSVFESLFNTLTRMKSDGYDLEVPPSVEALRARVLEGNAATYGQEANVAGHVDADTIVRTSPHLAEIEDVWGPAPGRVQSDGQGVFVLGADFGKVFVGVQPAFGYEGDPMRLLFERGFAPTHAFAAFYLWLRNTFRADVLLHFGMHGALEFMPGKQAGLGARDWPDRLIGEMPNVYLYASNNPSEATLAKRRSGAVTVTHLTPPLAKSGLYKGLVELKDSLTRWRGMAPGAHGRDELQALIAEQADAVDMDGRDPETLWLKLLETEDALIPDGLHVVGRPLSDAAMAEYGTDGKCAANPELLQKALADVELADQNLESVELGATTVDHYFDTLGGLSRAVNRARGGEEAAVYIGDQTRGSGKVRTLKEQVALETRARSLNPKFFEGLLKHGAEGVRQIEAQVTNTLGWLATTGQVDPWVYQRISETVVLDEEMRKRLADLNPVASSRMANRLLEASDRNYWAPDADTLAALQDAADAIEDQMEGVAAQ